MLDFQIQQFPLRLGLAEGVEPHQTPPGTTTIVENFVWKKTGKAEKRFGVDPLPMSIAGGGTISAGARIFARGSELCLIDGQNLYTWSPEVQLWRLVGAVPTVGLDWTTGVDAVTGAMAMDQAVSADGIQVLAWVVGEPTAAYGTTGALRFLVRGPLGETLIAPTTANAGTNHLVRTLIIGTTAYIFFQNSTAIASTRIDLTTLAVTLGGPVVSNVKVQGWDACVIGNTIVFAYEDTANGLKLKSVDTSLAGLTTGSISGEAGTSLQCISIDGAPGEPLYVGYFVNSTGLVRAACADSSTLVQSIAPVTLENITVVPPRACTKVGTVRYSSTSALIAWSPQDIQPKAARTTAFRFTSAGAIDATVGGQTFGLQLVTAPFILGGAAYALLTDRPTNSSGTTYILSAGIHTVLMRIDGIGSSPFRYVGKVDVLIGGLTIAGAVARGSVVGSTAYFPVPFISAAAGTSPPYRQGIRLVRAFPPGEDVYRSTTYGGEAYFAGPVLCVDDGFRVFDYGFEREPFIDGSTQAAGVVPVGTYIYSAVREMRSAAGVLHRSPTCIPTAIGVAGGAKNITPRFVTGPVSNKQDTITGFATASTNPVETAVYRSLVGKTDLYRLTVDPTLNVSVTDSTVAADTSMTDARLDTDVGNSQALNARPPIYTTGGILDDYQPPASVTLMQHADRLWVLTGDRKTWWYSKAFQDDLGTAPGFHPNLRLAFNDLQTAALSLDDKGVFYSANGVKYLLGIGPTPNGLNSDFQGPFTIQSDVGCINARSLVATPDGHMFLSSRGIYLLTRGLELFWIGRQVQDQIAAFPVITSAVLVAKQNQVRFTCNTADGASGIVLVFDYVEKQWSTFRYLQSEAGGPGAAIADAFMWNGAWTCVTPAGQVWVESSTAYLDSGAWVYLTLETAWNSAAGPLGYQSVRNFGLGGVSYSNHDLAISVGFDGEESYDQGPEAFEAGSDVTAIGPLEHCSISINDRRKCSSIRFKVTDAPPTDPGTFPLGNGRGAAFDTMLIEVGLMRGPRRTSETRKG